jgi:hypothetical protein
MHRWLAMILAVVALSGCSTVPQELAQKMAAYTAKIKETDAGYAAMRDELAAARHAVVDQMNADAAAAEARNSRFIDAWRLAGDKRRIDMTDTLRKVSVPTVLPVDLQPAPPLSADTAAVVAAKARAEKLDSAAKALGTLAEGHSLSDDATFYTQFFQAIGSAVQDAREKETQETATAKNEVSTKAKELAATAESATKTPK